MGGSDSKTGFENHVVYEHSYIRTIGEVVQELNHKIDDFRMQDIADVSSELYNLRLKNETFYNLLATLKL